MLTALAFLALPERSTEGIQGKQGPDHGRIELWTNSLDVASQKPLLGHGQGSFLSATVDEQEAPVRFAHNLIVESAVELGVFGAFLSAVVLLGSLVYSWKGRLDPRAWICIPMIVGFSTMGMFDWVWYLSGVGAAWALCLGCVLIVPQGRTRTADT